MQFLIKINKYCLFLLVFSVTFENWNPFKLGGVVSVTYMASVLYILSWIPLLKKNISINSFKQYFIPLGIFTVIGIISTALNSTYAMSIVDTYDGRVILLVILMLLIANHLYNDNNLIVKVLDVYVVSIVLMYFMVLMGIGTEYSNGRLLLFGENPNSTGVKVVIAFLIIVSRLISENAILSKTLIRILYIFCTLNLIILTGSRGALISVFLGLAVLIMFMKINVWKKLMLGIVGLVFSILFLNIVMDSNPVFKKRIMNTIEKGDTGRSDLWIASLDIIEDNLFFGVSMAGALPAMFKQIGRHADPHNVFLYVFMTTGFFGFIFYMLFIFKLGRNLYKDFRATGQVLFIMILLVVLFNMGKSGGAIGKIFFWFFFAILIGSTFKSKYIADNTVDTIENKVS